MEALPAEKQGCVWKSAAFRDLRRGGADLGGDRDTVDGPLRRRHPGFELQAHYFWFGA